MGGGQANRLERYDALGVTLENGQQYEPERERKKQRFSVWVGLIFMDVAEFY